MSSTARDESRQRVRDPAKRNLTVGFNNKNQFATINVGSTQLIPPQSTTLLVRDERQNMRLSDFTNSQMTLGPQNTTLGESSFSPLASGANLQMSF